MILRALALSLALAAAFLAGTMVPTAETQSGRHFLRIDYMRIPDGQALRYRNLETELWKPVHQLRVDKGYITSWRLYGHHFPGGESDYQYVTVTEFPSLQAMDELHYPELFQEAHGRDYDTEISQQTVASRTLTHTDLWALIDSVSARQR
ncbi:MAG: hypothetical protein F4X77_02565 [Acidobacteriia bacterium]|nr:hypothetical protein [Terriglobia bacterium]MYC66898.1 hypothetical protein [Terriglobia bacterium]